MTRGSIDQSLNVDDRWTCSNKEISSDSDDRVLDIGYFAAGKTERQNK